MTLASITGCFSPPAPEAYQPDASVLAPRPPRERLELPPIVRREDRPPPSSSGQSAEAREVSNTLPLPDLSDEQIVRTVAGIRPYRRAGVRIETERLPDGRPLIHNVGHGGAGITLAWGSAEEVRSLLAPQLSPPGTVAVLGAGIIGLTTAERLRRLGYRVSVYGDGWTPHTTSDIAGGQFAPSLVEIPPGRAGRSLMDRLLRRSFHHYLDEMRRNRGVEWRDNYATEGHGMGLTRIPSGLLPAVRRLDRLPFPGAPRRGRVHRTLLIETPRYLAALMQDLRAGSVSFHQRRFQNRQELRQLPQRAVINCLGYGARAVFGESLQPVRGQLVHLRPQRLNYLLSHRGYLFSRRDQLILGGTAEWNVDEARTTSSGIVRILATHRRFFSAGDGSVGAARLGEALAGRFRRVLPH